MNLPGSSLSPGRRRSNISPEDMKFYTGRAIRNPLGFYDWILDHITDLSFSICSGIFETVRLLSVWERSRPDRTEMHAIWSEQIDGLEYLLAARLEVIG